MSKRFLALMLIAAAGCDRDRPPAPTSEQSARLDEAEAMLNEMTDNEKGAAPEDPAPSSNLG